jgi:hypothetical protein
MFGHDTSYSARAHRALSKSPWGCGSISSRARDTRQQTQRVQHRCAPVVLMGYALPRTDTALARAPCARGGSLWLFSTLSGVAWLHSRPVRLVCGVCRHALVFFVFRACFKRLDAVCHGRVSVLIRDSDMVACYVECIHMLKSSLLKCGVAVGGRYFRPHYCGNLDQVLICTRCLLVCGIHDSAIMHFVII